eukprot:TRINITY_DN11860_c0_g1_i4.p4 TRINITY_DN11860_c0_g1~~TRINITY_DN11860_c0_g1_i4.p4  ORF type:complete len:107 (+),score=8.43 TRINITY_DN11860_c0_g1_i4:180-500(+)
MSSCSSCGKLFGDSRLVGRISRGVHGRIHRCSRSFLYPFHFEGLLVIQIFLDILISHVPVSYTHLTLPTILLVQISVVAVSLKIKNLTTPTNAAQFTQVTETDDCA